MKRSEFLRSLGVLLGASCAKQAPPAAAPPPAAPAAPPPEPAPPEPVRHYRHFAWLTAEADASDDSYKRRFERMKRSGVSVVLAEAFNGSQAFYASGHLPHQGDWLGRVLPLAERAGLELHAWVSCMPCNVEAVLSATPEWYMVNKQGESTAQHPVYLPEYRFLCPTRPEVRAFIKRRVQELAEYPIAGVHLDTVQFPWVILPPGLQVQYGVQQEEELPQYDFCYCEACRARFQEQTQIDPMNFNQPSSSEVWRQFRHDRLSELVNQDLVPTIRQAGKVASAAVLPDWENARQNWGKWQLDAAFPLLYHALYDEDISWIGFQTQQSVTRLGRETPCYSGLLISHLSAPDLTGAVRLALESGAGGVGLYSGQAMSDLHWQAFERAAADAEAEAGAGAEPASG